MSNRRQRREKPPERTPAASKEASFEQRPFAPAPEGQPHSAPASVGHAFGQVHAPIQAKSSEAEHAPRPNQTGLPDQLKAGIETLSGMNLDGVHVHYSSSKPAQLNALAYAQGTDIHVAPGQEKHLPHEAWHVVQQAQGRVRPTIHVKDSAPINDDPGLEHEADAMGAQALASTADPALAETRQPLPALGSAALVQRKKLVTMGGTFDTGQYEAVTGPIDVKGSDHTQDVGGVIDMSFMAKPEVSGSFGLVQTGKAVRNKQADYNKDRTDLKERMQDEHGADPGRFMDRSKFKENPIFGLQNQKALLGDMAGGTGIDFTNNRDAIATRGGKDTAIVKETEDEDNHDISDVGGKVGSRTSPTEATAASLRDEPARTRHLVADQTSGDAIRMEFETAALVLSGDMEGTYLGSVQWGFEIGEHDKKGTPLAFEIVSMGTPTPAFMESAQAWNDQAMVSTGGTNTTQSLPVHVTNHAPDLALQKLIADDSAAKEAKIAALQQRITVLSRAQDTMKPETLAALKQAVADATSKFDQAKAAIDRIKQERKDLAGSVDSLRTDRQTAGKQRDTGKTTLDSANSNLSRIGNKTPFYKARKLKDEAAVKTAQTQLDGLEAALVQARAAVSKAETDIAQLDTRVAGFNKSAEVTDFREARINLQNEKADLNNVAFELTHLLKTLDELQSA